ncbi:MAG: translation initiation factor IF-1 [Verrucomicrobiota bacterium]
MPGDDRLEVECTIAEELPNSTFRVRFSNGHTAVAHLSSEVRFLFTRILPGAKVLVEFTPYDLRHGRIIPWPEGSPQAAA